MRFAFFLSRRYLFSKKSTNAINVISYISLLGVAFGTAALIIILSVFNGFEEIVVNLYTKVGSDLLVKPIKGKFFQVNEKTIHFLNTQNEIDYYSTILEDNVLLQYGANQYFARLKGVSDNFLKNPELEKIITRGDFVLKEDTINYLVISKGVEYHLGINLKGAVDQISVFAARKNVGVNFLNPENGLNRMELYPSGIFQSQQELDEKTVFSNLETARKIFERPVEISSLELYLKDKNNIASLQKKSKEFFGPTFQIENKFEQNKLLFKVLNSEKLAVYLILAFILFIAIINILGSITMLILDKKKDLSVLISMGASTATLRKVFLLQGLILSFIGAMIGFSMGFLFCILQIKFGFIKFQNSGQVFLDAYPVKIMWVDFIVVFATVFIISFLASYFSSRINIQKERQLVTSDE